MKEKKKILVNSKRTKDDRAVVRLLKNKPLIELSESQEKELIDRIIKRHKAEIKAKRDLLDLEI
ncbi:MAG: hypothetical protein ACOCZ8_01900 [Bacteroidota bacterium]